MGIEERRERERDEIRAKILDAARELFAKEGYGAVTMRRIAEKIEYSPTAIYGHFADKDALIHELAARDFLELAHQFARLAKINDPIERFTKIGPVYVEFGLAHPNHYQLMFMTPRPISGAAADRIFNGDPAQDAYAFLKHTAAEAIASGRLRSEYKDPELLAQAAWASVHGVVSLHIAKRNDAWIDWRPPRRVARMLAEALFRGLLAEPN